MKCEYRGKKTIQQWNETECMISLAFLLWIVLKLKMLESDIMWPWFCPIYQSAIKLDQKLETVKWIQILKTIQTLWSFVNERQKENKNSIIIWFEHSDRCKIHIIFRHSDYLYLSEGSWYDITLAFMHEAHKLIYIF